MRLVIFGSRNITDYLILEDLMARFDLEIEEIVSGGAMGADTLGEEMITKSKNY